MILALAIIFLAVSLLAVAALEEQSQELDRIQKHLEKNEQRKQIISGIGHRRLVFGADGAEILAMIVMVDSSEGLDVPADDLNGFFVEQLLTPLTRRRNFDPTRHFAIDNGAFARFEKKAFCSLLSREWERRHLCRFVAVPDVVGSARRTREVFEFWKHELTEWPLAYVVQDGQEDIDIPWSDINAVFIGGTDRFKEADAAIQCVKAAQLLGKWVHVGRVNTFSRFELYRQLGANSCDGTGVARYSHMRNAMTARPTLFSAEEIVNVDS